MPNAAKALCDAGPLVALYDPLDRWHEQSRKALKSFHGILLTTWPVFTEAMYFLSRQPQRELLWDFLFRGGVRLLEISSADLVRMRDLMAKYADLPMDFADASIVVVGERLKLKRVFTLDRRDFRLYRPRHVRSFEIFP